MSGKSTGQLLFHTAGQGIQTAAILLDASGRLVAAGVAHPAVSNLTLKAFSMQIHAHRVCHPSDVGHMASLQGVLCRAYHRLCSSACVHVRVFVPEGA